MNYGTISSRESPFDVEDLSVDTPIPQLETQSEKNPKFPPFSTAIFICSFVFMIVLWSQSYPHAVSSIRSMPNLFEQFTTPMGNRNGISGMDLFGLEFSGNLTLGLESENILDVNIVQPIAESSNNTIASTGEISFKLNRVGYVPIALDDSVFKYQFLQDYDVIIEPSVSMSLIVVDYSDNSIYYKYKLCLTSQLEECSYGVLSIDPTVAMGVDVTVSCSPYDEYTIFVNEVSSSTGDIVRSTTGRALCMYVRREIRSLSEDDLSKTLDAMYTVYSVDEETGQELYGEKYHDSLYLLEFHHFNAAWQDADHIHEGNGFLPQHIKMTNLFEQAMQSVDPSVSLPYWDFTLDQSEGKTSVSSYIMTPSIFGNMNQPNDLNWGFTSANDDILSAAILDGRWAYLKTDFNTKYPELLAGYGYMRAPWNMNPSPYITRFTMDLQIGTSLPTCSQHYEVLGYENMMDFFYQISYASHATTHSLTGGVYGCDLLIPLLDQGYILDETSLKTICASWVFYLKEFYRYNFILPKSNCPMNNVSNADCGFICPDPDSTELKFNLKNKLSSTVPSDMGDDGWQAWLDFVCEGDGGKIFSGDHLESASPADPSFWPIHPTLERLLHAKFMSGGFSASETWATDPINDNVCDKAVCYESQYNAKDSYEECCYGHYETDRTLDFVTGNKSNYILETNAEIVSMTDPRYNNYSMTYIYDSFSWKHCTQGLESFLTDLYSSYLETHPTPTTSPTSTEDLINNNNNIDVTNNNNIDVLNIVEVEGGGGEDILIDPLPTDGEDEIKEEDEEQQQQQIEEEIEKQKEEEEEEEKEKEEQQQEEDETNEEEVVEEVQEEVETLSAPTQFPTEKAPTLYPSPSPPESDDTNEQAEEETEEVKYTTPTQYPTGKAPTPYPVSVRKLIFAV